MPSVLLGNPIASGPQIIVSGNPWSGRKPFPQNAGITLRWVSTGGNAYIYLSGGNIPVSSGGPTITSGGMYLSGGLGLMDGMILLSGESCFVPATSLNPTSGGQINVCAACDAAGSGIGRLWWEPDFFYKR